VTIDVLANDSAGSAAVPLVASSLVLIDGNGNAVTTLSVSGGTYSVVGGKVVFTPNADFAGTAPAATYRVSYDMGNTGSSTVSVDVTTVTPIARPDTATTYRNTSVTVDVLANDCAGAPNAARAVHPDAARHQWQRGQLGPGQRRHLQGRQRQGRLHAGLLVPRSCGRGEVSGPDAVRDQAHRLRSGLGRLVLTGR